MPPLFEVREALWCLCGLFQSVPPFNYPEQWAVSLSKVEVKTRVFLNTNNKDWYLQNCLKNWERRAGYCERRRSLWRVVWAFKNSLIDCKRLSVIRKGAVENGFRMCHFLLGLIWGSVWACWYFKRLKMYTLLCLRPWGTVTSRAFWTRSCIPRSACLPGHSWVFREGSFLASSLPVSCFKDTQQQRKGVWGEPCQLSIRLDLNI